MAWKGCCGCVLAMDSKGEEDCCMVDDCLLDAGYGYFCYFWIFFVELNLSPVTWGSVTVILG